MPITDKLSRKAGFHRFEMGELELTVVSDGHILFDPKQPILAPDISEEEVNKVLEDYFLPTTYVHIAMNIVVIRKGAKIILLDAGAGNTMGPSSGWLPGNLAVAGIQPMEVTDVILTHAHSDHIGGLLKDNGLLTFPNAYVYLTKVEHDFWLGDKIDLPASKLVDKEGFIHFSTKIIKDTVKALGDKLNLIETDALLFDIIKLIPAPGHTPGHVGFRIASQGEELIHMGDSAHTHVLLFAHPEWGFEADADFDQGVATRRQMMAQLTDGRKRVFAFHLPWPGLGHIRRKGEAFEWVCEPFTSFNAE